MRRLCDVLLCVLCSPLVLLLAAAIAVLIKATSRGPVIHWSDRVGRDNQLFRMPKFRSMRTEAPQLATHLLPHSGYWITPVGRWLRKSSLDELPQLWSVLRGEMTLIGPRPALFNQHDLIARRTKAAVHRLVPGITGWAQVNGRDELETAEKVRYDAYYAAHRSWMLDGKILLLTVVKVLRREGIRQREQRLQREAPAAKAA